MPTGQNEPAQTRQADPDRQTASLAGLTIALALIVLGLFLARELSLSARVDDCLLAGLRSCDALLRQDR